MREKQNRVLKSRRLNENAFTLHFAARRVPCKSTREFTAVSYLTLREPVGNHGY